MTETLGGPSPESGEGKTPEQTEDSKRAQRERKKQRKREERRQRRLAASKPDTAGAPSAPDVSIPPAPAPDKAPTITTPDTRPAVDPVAPPDVVVIPPPDIFKASSDDEDDDASLAAPLVFSSPSTTPPDSPFFGPDTSDPDDADFHYVFLPGEKGIDDKAMGVFKKTGKGLGFAGMGVLGFLGHGVRITAKKTHHAVDGFLYALEKWMYDHSGSKTTIPWKWFTKEPKEPEYRVAAKRAEELIKRGTGKEKKK